MSTVNSTTIYHTIEFQHIYPNAIFPTSIFQVRSGLREACRTLPMMHPAMRHPLSLRPSRGATTRCVAGFIDCQQGASAKEDSRHYSPVMKTGSVFPECVYSSFLNLLASFSPVELSLYRVRLLSR